LTGPEDRRGGRGRAHGSSPGDRGPHLGGLVLRGQLRTFVLPAFTVFTDDAHAYGTLAQGCCEHQRINHSQRVCVHGNGHTNTIEGFWSLVKNGLRGTHHAVSKQWLQSYLDEFAWRCNHRHDPEPMFTALLRLACRAE
jgi:transposase